MGYYEEGEQYFLHAYGRYDTVLDHGEGVYLYDTEGNKYLDFYSGIGVNSCLLGPSTRINVGCLFDEEVSRNLHKL